MYRNRPQHFTTSQQPIFKLPAFQEDNRLAFLDSVCATLMTSRFGWGAMYTLNPRFEGTADEPVDYLGLLEEDSIGWHEAATFPGEKRENHLRKRVALAFGQVVLIGWNGASFDSLGRDGPTLRPPAYAGGSPFARGSPTFLGRSSSRLPLRPKRALRENSGLSRKVRKEHAKKSWDVRPTY
jgi:hypothetical protein